LQWLEDDDQPKNPRNTPSTKAVTISEAVLCSSSAPGFPIFGHWHSISCQELLLRGVCWVRHLTSWCADYQITAESGGSSERRLDGNRFK
jgi:hypothetical protein